MYFSTPDIVAIEIWERARNKNKETVITLRPAILPWDYARIT